MASIRRWTAALAVAVTALSLNLPVASAERPPPPPPSTGKKSTPRAAVAPPDAADDGGSTISVPPVRFLDTRDGTGRPAGSRTPVGTNQTIDLKVAGVGPVPAEATAVVLNLTATEPTAAGFITAWPAGQPRPLASNLNVVPGQTVPNLVTVGLGADGAISLYNFAGATHLIADVQAYVIPQTPSSGGLLVDLPPSRLLDTRNGNPGKVGSNQSISLDVTGVGGVPNTGVSAVVLNLTATEPTAAGYVTAYPTGSPRPLASTLNVVPGDTVPNRVIVPVGNDGTVSFYNYAGSVHLIADVGGYFTDPTVTDTGSGLLRLQPTRLLDTRTTTKIAPGTSRRVQISGVAGIPGMDAEVPPTAVVLNLTATNPTAATFLTAWPAGQAQPLASDLNVRPGETRPNLTMVKLGPTGAVDIYNNAGTVDLVVDVFAYYAGGVVVDPALEVLDPPQAAAVTGIDASSITFSGTIGQLGFQVGDILASAPTPAAPDGFLRRVTALSEDNGVVKATAEPVALDEAVERGSYDGPIELITPGPSAQAAQATITAPFNLAIEGIDGDPNDNVVASAALKGQLSMTAGLSLKAKMGFLSGVEVDFEGKLATALSADLSVTGAYQFLSREKQLFEHSFAGVVFFIGPVPVYVEPEFELSAGVEGQAKSSIGATVTRSESVSLGFKMRNADIQPFVNSSGTPTTFTVNQPSASVELGVELQATLEAEFYGGFELGVGIAPGLTAEVGTECGFDLKFGIDALAEFEVEMFGKEIGEGLEFRSTLFEQSLLKKTVPGCEDDKWSVDTSVPAPALATGLAGPGVAIQSATSSGSGQVGKFTAPFGSIGLNSGTVLSTGDANGAPGPNQSSSYGTGRGGPGDPQLSAIAGGTTFDTAALDITFVPTTATVEFSFVFGSDEYLEYVDSGYNDVFGAFVNGQNCAVIKKGFDLVPSTVNAINHLRNTLEFRDNSGGGVNVQADGITTVLRCTAAVTPNVPNTLRLAIADTRDAVWDSWAFIQSGSLRAI